ncbi:MAG: hypothetical protein JNM84_06140 [Planctomycetes bacterium]|nr:hypothetical protein [Planctomycetota bacterium]
MSFATVLAQTCAIALLHMTLSAQEVRDLDRDLALLVPKDTVLLVHVASLGEATAQVRTLLRAIDEDIAEQMDLSSLLELFAPTIWMDAQGPLTLAFRDPRFEEPPVAIFRPRDAASFDRETKELRSAASGSFRALQHPGGIATEPPAMTRGLPLADLVARMDAASFSETWRSEVEEPLAQAAEMLGEQDPSMAGIMEFYVDLFRNVFDASLELDLGFEIDGTMVDLRGRYRVRADSAFDVGERAAPRLQSLVGSVRREDPVAFFAAYDYARLLEAFVPMYRSMEALLPGSPKYADSFEQLAVLYRGAGPEYAGSFSLGDGGWHLHFSGLSSEPADFVKRYVAWMDSLRSPAEHWGLETTTAPSEVIAGRNALVHHLRPDWDTLHAFAPEIPRAAFDSLFGKASWKQVIVAGEDRFVLGFGSDGATGRAQIEHALRGESSVRPDLRKLLDRCGNGAVFGLSIELRATLRAFLGLAALMAPEDLEIPEVPSGDPIPFLFFWAAQRAEHRFGYEVDVAAFSELVRALSK